MRKVLSDFSGGGTDSMLTYLLECTATRTKETFLIRDLMLLLAAAGVCRLKVTVEPLRFAFST